MISATLNMNPGALASVQAAGWERLVRGVVLYHTRLLEALNVSNPRPYRTPARKGEPPRKRTGFGQRNVLYELDEPGGTAKVGVARPAKYLLFLELKGWPWLLATLEKHRAEIEAVLKGG